MRAHSFIGWIPVAGIAAALALGAPAAAQTEDVKFLRRVFDRWDRDGDAQVARAEFPGSDEQFTEIDGNRSGALTRDEFVASGAGKRLWAAHQSESQAPRRRADVDELALRRLEGIGRFDANGDGRLTRAEWNGTKEAFAELDVDGDGKVDADDKARLRKRVDPAELPTFPALDQRLPRPDELIARLDKDGDQRLGRAEVRADLVARAFAYADRNGDGLIDERELDALVRAVDQRLAERDRGAEQPRAYRVPFDAWDKNGDGRLAIEEWVDERHLFPRVDADRDAAVTRDEIERYRRSVEGTTFFERFDLDGDGRVTRGEFAGPPGGFRRADRNGDGVITLADR
jgi:Ca2+-binding EF-hand superfamily protein